MRLDEIKLLLTKHAAKISNFGVKSPAVFGSISRGEAHEGSDADFLVEFERNSFDGYMDLKLFLEDLLGVPVDLVTQSSLRPELHDAIMQESRFVA